MYYGKTYSTIKNNFGYKTNTFINPRFNWIEVLDKSEVSIGSLYWFKVYKTSESPFTGISTDYYAIGSTDHDASDGGVIWGECDDMYLRNFVEKGTIVSGYQAEAPFFITRGGNGYLFYSTDSGDPVNSGSQQTHLLTTPGGNVPHLCTWTQEGTVLGLEAGESNTGYLTIIERGVNDYIGFHLTKNVTGDWRYSTSTDLETWTRGDLIDNTLNLPSGYYCSYGDITPFTFNETSYVFTGYYTDGGDRGYMICTHDSNYRPNSIVAEILPVDDISRSYSMGIEGDRIFVLRKTGINNSDTGYPYKAISYNLLETA